MQNKCSFLLQLRTDLLMSIDDQVATLFEHDKAAKKLCFVDHDYIRNQREFRYQGRLG